MAGLLDGVDLTNPCLVWPKLQEAYYRLMAGEREVKIRFTQEEVDFHPGSMQALQVEITRLKALCDKAQGKRTRTANRAAFRRQWPWTDC